MEERSLPPALYGSVALLRLGDEVSEETARRMWRRVRAHIEAANQPHLFPGGEKRARVLAALMLALECEDEATAEPTDGGAP